MRRSGDADPLPVVLLIPLLPEARRPSPPHLADLLALLLGDLALVLAKLDIGFQDVARLVALLLALLAVLVAFLVLVFLVLLGQAGIGVGQDVREREARGSGEQHGPAPGEQG